MTTYLCPLCRQPLRRDLPASNGDVSTLWCQYCHLILRDWPIVTRCLRVAHNEEAS